MKKLVYLLMFMPFIVLGQTKTENYVKNTTYKVKTTNGTTKVAGGSVSNEEKQVSISYFDGLGRAKQNVIVGAGGNKEDIITHIDYDKFGRQVKEYLPYASGSYNQRIRTGSIESIQTFYKNKYPDDFLNTATANINAYSQKVLEASPLNRVLEQAAPGKDWKVGNGHTIKFDYQANAPKEVLNFGVEFEGGNTAKPKLKIADSYYNPNELYKTITKDENWRTWDKKDKTTEEFKNKQGQVLLKRTYNNQQAHDTYYVYDDFGNLTYVLPPLASEKTIIYETGMKSYPASTFVNGSGARGSVTFGVEKISAGQYRYVAKFDLHNLANSNFKSGEIMDLPYFNNAMSNFWLGGVSVSNSSGGSWAYKSASFYVNNGKLFCYTYEYNRNNIPLAFSSFNSTRTNNLPQNLQGFSEAATQGKVNELLNKLCYQYKYDSRNRLIEKRIPGKDWEYIVYNLLDQPVLTQDAHLRAQGKWVFTKYDAFGRVAYTGMHNSGISRIESQKYADNKNGNTYTQFVNKTTVPKTLGGTSIYYTNKAIPFGVHKVHTINYYDSYTNVLPSDLGNTITTTYGVTSTTDTKGLPTVSKVRILDKDDWITTVTYYDDKARPIYVYSKNSYLNTTDIVESKLDFTGKVLETRTTHKKTGKQDIITVDKLEYDHADRLLSQTQEINNKTSERIVKNTYDELGQLSSKLVGNGTQVGYKDVVGITVDANQITKTANNGWGSGGLATSGAIEGDGYVSYTNPQTNKWFMVGLSPNNINASYNTIKYAMYNAGSIVYVYESGIKKGRFATSQANDVFRIERKGTRVKYLKNNTVIYTSTVSSTGTLIGDVSIHSKSTKIKDLKIVDNNKALQEVDYTYNIRGWLKKINDPEAGLGRDLFATELLYNDPGGNLSNSKLYNGNISQTIWKTANDNTSRYYNYYYDDLNRITRASYYSWNQYSRFNVGSISYDKNGNIQRLYRRGAIVENPDIKNASHYGTMDYLTYTYDGNQLKKVTDTGNKHFGFRDGTNSGDDYTYDANGNMLTDANKTEIANITYNYLNLPTFIKQSNKNIAGIAYVYDATGTKIEKRIIQQYGGGASQTTTTSYAGNYVYENNNLEFFNTSEGYVTPNNVGEFDYIYQHKDHLGNIRLSYTENPNSNQETVFTDGFESMANWDKSENSFGWALSAVDSSKKKSGSYSGRIDAPNYPSQWSEYVYSDTWTPINNTEDTYYTVSAWVYSEDVTTDGHLPNLAKLFIATRKQGQTGYPTGHYSATSTKEGVWEYVTTTVLIPADAKEMNVRIENARLGRVWFDDVKIVKGNASQTVIVEEKNYYPFGLVHRGYNNVVSSNGNSTAQKFGYNGKELNEELGLDWHDFGARNYDASLGRWMNLDPLAEQMRRHSPYNYAFNNPIYFIDPDGMKPTDWYIDRRTGKVLGKDGSSTNNLRVIKKEEWDYVQEDMGGSLSAEGTSELQANSKLVTVNESQIQNEVQSVADDTKSEGVENQAFLTLNVNTGEVAAQRGPDGDNSETTIETHKMGNDGAPRTGSGLMLLAQVHGHPQTTESGRENIPGTSSDKDKPTAVSLGVTIFAIDSYNGTTGGQYNMHSVNKSGTQTNFVGKTKGAGTGTINFTEILTNLLKAGR